MAGTQASGASGGGPARRQALLVALAILALIVAAFLAPAIDASGPGTGSDGPGQTATPTRNDGNSGGNDGGNGGENGSSGEGRTVTDESGEREPRGTVTVTPGFRNGSRGGSSSEGERSNATFVVVDGNNTDSTDCIVAVDRRPIPGKLVRVLVLDDGSAVTDRPVAFNGDRIGRTDGRGVVQGRVPYNRTLRITVELADGDGCAFAIPTGDGTRGGGASGDLAGGTGVASGTVRAGSSRFGVVDRVPIRSVRTTRTPGDDGNVTGNHTIMANASVSVSGEAIPGETVTVVAAIEDVPMRNSSVIVDGRAVGKTDTEGRYELTVPAQQEATVTVRRGDFAGRGFVDIELLTLAIGPQQGFPFPGEPAVARAAVDEESITAPVTLGGRRLGTTNASGTLRFSLPADPRQSVRVAAASQERSVSLWEVYAPTLAGLGAIAMLGGLSVLVVRYFGYSTRSRQLSIAWLVLAGVFGAVVVAEQWGLVAWLLVGLVAGGVRFGDELEGSGEATASLLATAARWAWGACRTGARALEQAVIAARGLLASLVEWAQSLPRSITGLAARLRAWLVDVALRLSALDWRRTLGYAGVSLLALAFVGGSTARFGGAGLISSTVVLVALAAAWRYWAREEPATTGSASTGPDLTSSGPSPTGDEDASPEGRPSLRELWRRFARTVTPTAWRRKTPGEVARQAIDEGYPTQPVRTLTRAFRDVEYGERPLSEPRYERASDAYDSLSEYEQNDSLSEYEQNGASRTDGAGRSEADRGTDGTGRTSREGER